MMNTQTGDKMTTLNDIFECFYVPGSGSTIDMVHPVTELGLYSGETLKQIQVRHPGTIRGSCEDALNSVNDCFRSAPREITKATFERMLNVLPPVDFTGDTFKMSERMAGNITGIYARIGRRYFTMDDDIRMSYGEIIAKFKGV